MNPAWKIILFFLVCIALGLGIGAVGQKIFAMTTGQEKSSSAVTPVPVVQPTEPETDDPVTPSPNTPAVQPVANTEPVAAPTTAALPKIPFSCPQPTDPNQKDLWLTPVGPIISIGNYIPADLVPLDNYVPTTTSTICLTKTAAVALQSMFTAMHAQQLYPMITSGFRDANYQGNLREETNVVTNGYSSVALPGHSEHQLGMAVDFIGIPDKTNMDYSALNDFGKTLDYAWLVQNASSYGFVQSYQAGDEPVTGYIAEPWHWRYVGVANAKAIVAARVPPVQYLQDLQAQAQ
jgi:zinc D-Ala-D-Ala carboxypeptidase